MNSQRDSTREELERDVERRENHTIQTATVIRHNFVDTDDIPFLNTTNTIASTALSLMRTVLFFLWFKFTSYGASLRRIIGKTRKLKNKPKHKKAFTILKCLSKSKDKGSRKSLFSIPYNPS
ncbi:hypothetical protein POVWA2_075970 [Plasmodium ovale wallikeri]|uniref:PIR Superfamily Protein n=1 Tax=Plasmodium ovale wallikeri TaxID=864142 RepID=A0A1A9AKI7_PLAOA|nr:hypothetical protein POVWA1_077050 [Plasmodium ovale wallikeri]SBT56906.1 hypothetical protein POVWA2_075970 [Plasmodium ovale wallikeri]